MSLLFLAVLAAPVDAPKPCRMDNVSVIFDGILINAPLNDEAVFAQILAGCQRHYGAKSCPFLIDIKSDIDHRSIRCEKAE